MIGNWHPLPDQQLDARQAYGGEDTWLGPYFGTDLHGGLDLAVPNNTTLFAPIDFDDQFYFTSVAKGQNNNRWRGIRRWPNGDEWQLQSHHLVQPLVPEHTPLRRGTPYAYAGGMRAGFTSHIHYVFRVTHPDQDPKLIDPWILFWQYLRHQNDREQGLRAAMLPVSPRRTGEMVTFSSAGSRHGLWGQTLEYTWDFGDGSISTKANPGHVFVEPGVYPVTLTVTDRAETRTVRQHITVNGSSLSDRSLRVVGPDPRAFRSQPSWKTLVHAEPAPDSANTLVFYRHQWDRTEIPAKTLHLLLGSTLRAEREPLAVSIEYVHGHDWLSWASEPTNDGWKLTLTPQADTLIAQNGFYETVLSIEVPGAVNSPLAVRVRMDYSGPVSSGDVVIAHSDPSVVKSEYFWLAPSFDQAWTHGVSGPVLFGASAATHEFVRFRPLLEAGNYRVSLHGPAYTESTLMDRVGDFSVRIKHRDGQSLVRIDPSQSQEIGSFAFATGREHFVEVISDHASGLIVVDALHFEKLP